MRDSLLLGRFVAAFGVCLVLVALGAGIGGNAYGANCSSCAGPCDGAVIPPHLEGPAHCSMAVCIHDSYTCTGCDCKVNPSLPLVCKCMRP